MAIAFVQKSGVESVGVVSSAPASFTSNNTAGNLLVIVIIIYDGGGANRTVTVSDSLGNTYAQAGWSNSTGQAGISYGIYYAKNCKGGANTVTVTGSASVYTTFGIHEYSGANLTAPFDKYSNGYFGAATGPSVSITAAVVDELLIGGSGQYFGNTQGAGAGCTLRYSNTDYTDQPIITEDKGTGGGLTAASQSLSWTYSPGSNCDCWVASFIPIVVRDFLGGLSIPPGISNYVF